MWAGPRPVARQASTAAVSSVPTTRGRRGTLWALVLEAVCAPGASCPVLHTGRSTAERHLGSSPNSSAGSHPSCALHSPTTSEPQGPVTALRPRLLCPGARRAPQRGQVGVLDASARPWLPRSVEKQPGAAAGLLWNELPDPWRPVTLGGCSHRGVDQVRPNDSPGGGAQSASLQDPSRTGTTHSGAASLSLHSGISASREPWQLSLQVKLSPTRLSPWSMQPSAEQGLKSTGGCSCSISRPTTQE